MKDCGVPILPGSEGILKSRGRSSRNRPEDRISGDAQGFGGRRRARHADGSQASELPSLLTQAQQEAGSGVLVAGRVYGEAGGLRPGISSFRCWPTNMATWKCSASAIVLSSGGIRSCEEGPSPAMTSKLRDKMKGCLATALKKIGYTNAGTVEFLMEQAAICTSSK